MEIKIEYTDRTGTLIKSTIRGGYLTKFIKANKKYPVSYTIDNKGNRLNEPSWLKGEDLTEPQMIDLFMREKM